MANAVEDLWWISETEDRAVLVLQQPLGFMLSVYS